MNCVFIKTGVMRVSGHEFKLRPHQKNMNGVLEVRKT
jgi:hypothetical protein